MFLVSIPHSGEVVPNQVTWLRGLSEPILMCDVDRFVDQLYVDTLDELKIAKVVAFFHRYVVDLNRLPTDVDQKSVVGASAPAGTHKLGFHWTHTTLGFELMKEPISQVMHEQLIESLFKPFHLEITNLQKKFHEQGHKNIFHLDAHSMPSMGTSSHRDPGQRRPDIVVSDQDGVSSCPEFKDLVIAAYQRSGFHVGYNWPYKGGRITEVYGQPKIHHHTLQVELNRALYMNEVTKQQNPSLFQETKGKIKKAITEIHSQLPELQKRLSQ